MTVWDSPSWEGRYEALLRRRGARLGEPGGAFQMASIYYLMNKRIWARKLEAFCHNPYHYQSLLSADIKTDDGRPSRRVR